MVKKHSGLAFIALSLQTAMAPAAPVELSIDYLLGKWSTAGAEGCDADNAGYVVFRNNHTLEAGSGAAATVVGFWELDNDGVIAHLLMAPSPGREAHPFYQQRYHYQNMAPKVLNIQPDSLEYTHDTGAEVINRRTLTRCK